MEINATFKCPAACAWAHFGVLLCVALCVSLCASGIKPALISSRNSRDTGGLSAHRELEWLHLVPDP